MSFQAALVRPGHAGMILDGEGARQAMEYLIDGNNLLHAAHPHGRGGAPIGRERLCQVLGEWARRTRTPVVVIFDGAPPSAAFHRQMNATGIEVRFSAPLTADDVIEGMIAGAGRPRELRVVTGDRAIQSVARARRCLCIDSVVFADEVFTAEPAPRPAPTAPRPEKPGQPSPADTNTWLRQFDFDPDQPPDETDLLRH